MPSSCMLDGCHSQHFFGTGVIVYHSQNMGIAAVDKNTVAISASDVMLSFAAFPIEIPGEVNMDMLISREDCHLFAFYLAFILFFAGDLSPSCS